jgi:TolB protein
VPPRCVQAALAAVGVLAIGAAPAAAARIAFERSTTAPGSPVNLFTMKPDGTGVFQLTHDPGPTRNELPDWSPDRKRIVFDSDRAGPTRLWTIKPDGNGLEQLTKGQFDVAPAWSPTGTVIAFARPGHVKNGAPQFDVFTVRKDGTHVRKLTTGGSEAGSPNWSPKGNKIAFRRKTGTTTQIWTMRPDGTHPHKVTDLANGAHAPAWSPNGKWIAFASLKGLATEIFVVPAGGGTVKQVTTDGDGTVNSNPTWSKDSKRIVFSTSHSPPGGENIASIKLNGKGRKQIIGDPTGSTLYGSPSWF